MDNAKPPQPAKVTTEPQDPSQLCQECRYVFEQWDEVIQDEYTASFPHCQNVFALIEAASSGCHLCAQFLRNLETRGILQSLQAATIDVLNAGGLRGYNGYIVVNSFERILSGGRDQYEDCWLLELRFRPPDSSDREDDAAAEAFNRWPYEMSRDAYSCRVILTPSVVLKSGNKQTRLPSSSAASLWQAKKWLRNCLYSHHQCSAPQLPLPTRLIRVDDNRIRICESKTLQGNEKYATLSHCWGSLKILKLTSNNQQSLMQGVSLATLCKTFQDAIHITLNLGLTYIWIDSLCIIQNSPVDWSREASLMGNVYSGGVVNIAASSASDGSVGCFFNRDPSYVWRHTITTPSAEQHRYRSYDCIEDGISDACVFETPLARRAWVMQERLLAPRTIHFSSAQLFWECNTLNACEVFPDYYPACLTYGDFYLQKQPISLALWWKIVKLYSICDLTYSRDKLVAISGIAREISKRDPGVDYVAGLWRHELESQLCWKIRYPCERPDTPQSPSWSWAAVNGTTSLAQVAQPVLLIRVLKVDLRGYEPFGEVPDGTLRIACQELWYVGNCHVTMFLEQGAFHGVLISWDYKDIDWDLVILLPIRLGFSGQIRYVSGLVLRQTQYRGEFSRVGHFECPVAKFEEMKVYFKPWETHRYAYRGVDVAKTEPWDMGSHWKGMSELGIILLV